MALSFVYNCVYVILVVCVFMLCKTIIIACGNTSGREANIQHITSCIVGAVYTLVTCFFQIMKFCY